MSILKKRGARKEPAPAPTAEAPTAPRPTGPPADPFMGDTLARQFAGELAEGRWHDFSTYLNENRDWADRGFFVDVVSSSVEGRPRWLDEWVAAHPESATAVLFRGSHAVHWAWEARGGGRGRTVTPDAAHLFNERLVLADRELERAAHMDSADPTPYVRQLWVALGLQLGQVELRRRFDAATRRDRWNVGAHAALLQGVARKWGGSHERMFSFAREVLEGAPEGQGAQVVVAYAHMERWLDFSQEQDGRPKQIAYFQDPSVQAEVVRAADRYLRSPRFQSNRRSIDDRNWFAVCFWLMKDYKAQLEQQDAIGAAIAKIPWAWQGDPGWAFERARTHAQQQLANLGDGQ